MGLYLRSSDICVYDVGSILLHQMEVQVNEKGTKANSRVDIALDCYSGHIIHSSNTLGWCVLLASVSVWNSG